MQRFARIPTTLLTLVTLASCTLDPKQIGDPQASSDTGDSPDTGDSTDTDTGDSTDTDTEGPFDDCEGPFSSPNFDRECDGVGVPCDNAISHYNPDQLDQDNDGFGDVSDLCPTIASGQNTDDTDKDGIGNNCDRCRSHPDTYNIGAIDDPRMWVRNIPSNSDFDHDGIGDACDNCVTIPNCGLYDPDNPAPHGGPVPFDDPDSCQTDVDMDGIGDACLDPNTNLPWVDLDNAAGPVGMGPADDFDQDGIINIEDLCPRQPLEQDLTQRIGCAVDIDCNVTGADTNRRCSITPALNGSRYCNHPDADQDQVGDSCDSCVYSSNPLQVTDAGMQVDDEDLDFIGSVCELSSFCSTRSGARPVRFYDVAVEGYCCVTTYPGDGQLRDPDGLPVGTTCSDEDELAGLCRQLPLGVLSYPGIVELPPGCEDALADAGKAEATALTLADFGGNALELWSHMCRIAPADQDFDGVGDACDTCPFAFDPSNEPSEDPQQGAACTGEYADTPGARCSG